jgi:uncharacterized protein (TIGR03437 family)
MARSNCGAWLAGMLMFGGTCYAATATSITANPGTTPQSATTGTAFANTLAVTVRDSGNAAVPGVNVTFAAPVSGASGIFSNATTTITVVTNASGVAFAPFTANATPGGPYTVTAETGALSATFSLTNTSAGPASITTNPGTTPQSATIGTAFATALAVTVRNSANAPVIGANVTFTAPGSGASGVFSNATTTITVATNVSGVASAPFTANATAGGPYAVTAATGVLSTSFSLTNTSAGPASITANPGTSPQSAAISTAFATALAVTVRNSSNAPLPGINVTFTAPGSGASGFFSNATTTITVATNASGVAFAPFTSNATPGGPYTVAAAAGVLSTTFSLTNTSAGPTSITANPFTTPQSATVSTAFAIALAVTVRNSINAPLPGINVTFSAPASGPSGAFSNTTTTITVATNASGVASAPFIANATAGGPYAVTAAAGVLITTFSLTNSPGGPASITTNPFTTPQSAAVNTQFVIALAVTVRDSGNTAIPGINVTFTAPGFGASGVFSNSTTTITVATNTSGVASAPFTANGTPGGPYTVTATTGALSTAFALTNTGSALVVTLNPSDITVNVGGTATFTAAATGTPAPTVQWQESTNGGGTFSNLAGATATTLSFTASASENGNQYRAVFANGPNTATTTAARLTVQTAQTGPTIRAANPVVPAFLGNAGFSSNMYVEIYGSNFSNVSRQWAGADFNGSNAPTSLEGVRVTVNNKPAFVYYVSPGQININVPEDSATGLVAIQVTTPTGTSNSVSVARSRLSPTLQSAPQFNVGGKQYVVALTPDFTSFIGRPDLIAGASFVTPRPGDTVSIYALGAGPTNPSTQAGVIAAQNSALALPFQIKIGGVQANALFAGLVANTIGLYQFNVVIPNVAAGDQPIEFSVDGAPNNQNLFITVGQ